MAIPAVDSAAIVPILDEALGLAEEAILAQQTNQEKIATKDRNIADLERQLASQEKVILEKVAKSQTLNPVDLDRLFDRFEDLHIMTPKERTKLAAHIQRDPNLIFPLFLKAAEMLSGAPAEGGGISKDEAFGEREDIIDCDGWDDFAAGKVVRIKQ
jgi:hypothetical protein